MLERKEDEVRRKNGERARRGRRRATDRRAARRQCGRTGRPNWPDPGFCSAHYKMVARRARPASAGRTHTAPRLALRASAYCSQRTALYVVSGFSRTCRGAIPGRLKPAPTRSDLAVGLVVADVFGGDDEDDVFGDV